MRLVILLAATALFIANFAPAKENSPPTEPEQISATAVIRELNLARENPKLYATFAAESRSFHMIEQGRAVDEAVRFLDKARPLPPLTLSPGMCRAAADHCVEQVAGQLGHDGNDHSSSGAANQSLRFVEFQLGRKHFLQPENCPRGRVGIDHRRRSPITRTSQKHFQSQIQLCRRGFRSAREISHGLHDRFCRRIRRERRHTGVTLTIAASD